jgi:hypothetical protein
MGGIKEKCGLSENPEKGYHLEVLDISGSTILRVEWTERRHKERKEEMEGNRRGRYRTKGMKEGRERKKILEG